MEGLPLGRPSFYDYYTTKPNKKPVFVFAKEYGTLREP